MCWSATQSCLLQPEPFPSLNIFSTRELSVQLSTQLSTQCLQLAILSASCIAVALFHTDSFWQQSAACAV